MTQAIPKSFELTNELIDILASDQTLTEMDFHRYIRKIENLRDFSSRHFMFALTHAAYGRVDEALEYFASAMQIAPDEIVAKNYLAFVNKNCDLFEVADLSAKLSQSFVVPNFYFTAYQSSLFTGRFAKARQFAELFIKVSARKEAEKMQHTIASAEYRLAEFKQLANLTDEQCELIAITAVNVMASYNQHVTSLVFNTVKEENANTYVLVIKCQDPEIIANMNMDLAFALAEHEELYDKNFSAWFQGVEKENLDASN